MSPATFCSRCGHRAEKHAGEQGCIGRTDDGDCWCRQTYTQIISTAHVVVTPHKNPPETT